MGQLEGVVALVTGGGSGLGRAVVDRFVSEGAQVAVLDRDEKKLAALAQDHGDAVAAIQADARSLEDNQRAVAATVTRFGHLDTLVGMAAITEYVQKLSQIPVDRLESAFDEVMAINVKGYLFAAMAATPELIKTNGSMAFTLSTSGFFPGVAGPLYTISKHAGVGLVRHLAYELAPAVRVNGIIPGGVRGSDLRGPSTLGQQSRSLQTVPRDALVASMTPLCRMPDDHEYTPIYVLLASSEARFATGAFFFWDGGLGLVGHGMTKW